MIHYNYLSDWDSFTSILSQKEPFLYLIMFPHKLLFDNYTGFLIIIAGLQSYLLYYSTKDLYHRSFFLLFYLAIFFFEYHFNVLRVGLSSLFFLSSLATIQENKKKSLSLLALSIISHLSILILLPVFLSRAKVHKKQAFYISVLSIPVILIIYLLFKDIIAYKLSAYSVLELDGQLPLLVIGVLLITWVSTCLSKNLSRELKVALIIFSIFLIYSGFSAIAYRFYMISLLVFLYLLAEKKIFSLSELKFKYILLGSLSVLFLISFNVIYLISTEQQRRIMDNRGNPDFNYSPYSFYYDSKYR